MLLKHLVLPAVAVAASSNQFLSKTDTDGSVSVTLITTNDVYAVFGRPNSGNGFFFDGTPSDHFIAMCEENGDECFGTAAAEGLPEAGVMRLADMDFPSIGGKVFTSDEPGCIDPAKFDDTLRNPQSLWGNLADMAGTYKYLGLNGDHAKHYNLLPGDFIAMSYLALQTHGKHLIDMMNASEMDMVAFGNHDFQFTNKCPEANLDDHPEWRDLCTAWSIADSNFMWLGSNVFNDETESTFLGGDMKVPKVIPFGEDDKVEVPRNSKMFEEGSNYAPESNYWSQDVEGHKVCFTGSTDQAAANAIAKKSNLYVTPEMDNIVQAIRDMNDGGCDLVVVMTHMRTGKDVLLWQKAVVEEDLRVDAILGAHDHFPLFMNLKHPSKDIVTPMWKMGMDSQIIGKFTYDFPAGGGRGTLRHARAVPVFEGECAQHFEEGEHSEWWNKNVLEVFDFHKAPIEELAKNKLEKLQFEGLYNTADIRGVESRVGNMLADLMMRNATTDTAMLVGGNIRYGLSQVYNERMALNELMLFEENPFPDGMVAYEFTVMELYGYMLHAAPIAHGGSSASRPVVAGFEVEYDPNVEEHSGLTRIVFRGTSSFAGISDRKQQDCGHAVLKCGEEIWTAEDGFKVDPMTIISTTQPAYNARFSSTDAPAMRRAFHVTHMAELCLRGADSYVMDLNGDDVTYACPPGADFFAALNENLPWTDCGIKSESPKPEPTGRFTQESIAAADAYCQDLMSGSYCKYYQTGPGRVCQGNDKPCGHLLEEEVVIPPTEKPVSNCWDLVGESLNNRNMLMWTDEETTPEDVPRIDASTPIAEGSVYVAHHLPEVWNIGGDDVAELASKYGITSPHSEDMKELNLPVRRFTAVETGKAPNAFAYMAAAPSTRVVKRYGKKINPRTVLALH